MSKYLKTACVLAIAAAVFAPLAFAQDAVKVAPTVYKPLLDSDRVRVLEVTVKPGETIPFHSHPDYSVYVIAGGMARFFSSPADTGVVVELKTDDASWHNAEVHSAKNVGTTTIRVLVTELKEPKPAKGAAGASAQMYVCPMHADVTSDKPGKCSKCGMGLVKKDN